jgi:hypothetical protein
VLIALLQAYVKPVIKFPLTNISKGMHVSLSAMQEKYLRMESVFCVTPDAKLVK